MPDRVERGSPLYHAVIETIEVLIDSNPAEGSAEAELLDNLVAAVVEYERQMGW